MDDIVFYLRILLRKLHYVFAIALVVFLGTILAIRFIPPVYTASAKLLAEAPQIPSDLARSTVALSGTAQAQILQQQVTSREALLALSKRLNIYPTTPILPDEEEDMITDLRDRVSFEYVPMDPQNPSQSAALLVVSFQASDAVLAADVANDLALSIVGGNQRERADRAGNTLTFFTQKTTALEADLKRIEADILGFTNANRETLPESLEFRRNERVSLQERILSLEREEADLRTRRSNILATFSTVGEDGERIPISPQQQMLADLNRALSEQLTIYSDDSPMVTATRSRIAAVQKTIMSDGVTLEKTSRTDDGNTSFGPSLQLTDIDNRLETIARDKLTTTERLENLARSIEATPATESRLTALLRDRANIQTQYNSAIAQQAEASTGNQIEIRSDGQRFTLLESAVPPNKAAGLKRELIVAAGGLGGVGLGLAFLVLLELLNVTIRRSKELEGLLGAEALGTIPIIESRDKVRNPRVRHWMARAGLAVAILVAHCAPVALDPVRYISVISPAETHL
jgi:succinoglycan biosynthesis transport protein ExoP